LDIEAATAEDFATAFTDCDAVVFAAGGGPDGKIERKKSVDLEGSLKSIEAAKTLGIRRFVQISAMGVDNDPGDDASPVWKAYVEAKRDADVALRDSGLDWTIVRPGTLTNDPGTGSVTVGETVDRGEIPRADVAAVIAAALADDSTIGKQFEVITGDTPIADALRGL
ncbi:MAG: NAD(P)-binding oxidoreductase, partial [Aeromicrobium sp.]